MIIIDHSNQRVQETDRQAMKKIQIQTCKIFFLQSFVERFQAAEKPEEPVEVEVQYPVQFKSLQ